VGTGHFSGGKLELMSNEVDIRKSIFISSGFLFISCDSRNHRPSPLAICLSMKKFLFVIALLFVVGKEVACAEKVPMVWRWVDKYDETFYRINFKTRAFEKQAGQERWEELGKLKTVNFNELDRSPTIEVPNVIPLNEQRRDSLYIQIPGTGQVFLFTTQNATLERLDRTYYRGYNFRATVFKRKGLLYSVGGCGFWTQINSMTVYLPTAREWEIILPKSESPPYIIGDLTQYLPSRDVIISGMNFLKDSFHKDYTGQIDPTYWEYEFETNSWSRKGTINPALVEEFNTNLSSFASHLVGDDKLLIARRDKVPSLFIYYADLTTNKLYRYNRVFKSGDADSLMVTKNKVYIPEGFTTYLDRTVIPVTIEDIIRDSVPMGDFVLPEGGAGTRYLYWVVPGLALVAAAGYWVVRRKQKRTTAPVATAATSLSELDELENKVLEAVLKAYPASLSAEDLHTLLSLEGKSMDNQRKLRNEFLNAFNAKLKLLLQTEESIVRVASEKDRRINEYALKSEAWEKLQVVSS
jgi:hypothetical protein